jgi:hypothetical protein
MAQRELRSQGRKQVSLVEALGFGGVDVFRHIVAQRAPAEAEEPSRGTANREHQAIAEPVVGVAAAFGPGHQARRFEVGERDLGVERSDQVAPAVGRITQPVALDQLGGTPPLR